MSTFTKTLIEEIKTAPETVQREVFDFLVFLKARQTTRKTRRFSWIHLFTALFLGLPRLATAATEDFAPPIDERQLPKRMHSAMKEQPRITVGQSNADLIGADQRALQAAVDYVAALGGGAVEIGPGTYAMRDSLHLRPHVTVRGVKGQTILRKADAISSPLVRDGDYGEEQATVKTLKRVPRL